MLHHFAFCHNSGVIIPSDNMLRVIMQIVILWTVIMVIVVAPKESNCSQFKISFIF
jgi:hypothetical protein